MELLWLRFRGAQDGRVSLLLPRLAFLLPELLALGLGVSRRGGAEEVLAGKDVGVGLEHFLAVFAECLLEVVLVQLHAQKLDFNFSSSIFLFLNRKIALQAV